MSWGFKIASKSKEGLVKVIDQAVANSGGMPACVGDAIKSTIELATKAEGEIFVLETNGHVGSTPSTYSPSGGKFELITMPLAE